MNAIVFMVDSADHEKIEAARNELHNLLEKPQLQGMYKETEFSQRFFLKCTSWKHNFFNCLISCSPPKGIPVLVLGNKRDLPGALDENGIIQRMYEKNIYNLAKN